MRLFVLTGGNHGGTCSCVGDGVWQVESTLNMQNLQPKIKAIQTRYKGDQERIQLETARLYKQAGVNPLAGELSSLLQARWWVGQAIIDWCVIVIWPVFLSTWSNLAIFFVLGLELVAIMRMFSDYIWTRGLAISCLVFKNLSEDEYMRSST